MLTNTPLRQIHSICCRDALCLCSFLFNGCKLVLECTRKYSTLHESLEWCTGLNTWNTVQCIHSSQAAAYHVFMTINLRAHGQWSTSQTRDSSEMPSIHIILLYRPVHISNDIRTNTPVLFIHRCCNLQPCCGWLQGHGTLHSMPTCNDQPISQSKTWITHRDQPRTLQHARHK